MNTLENMILILVLVKLFIANSLHESGEYKFLEEILPKGVQEKDVYDGYKGRGIMQLTWFHNYKGYGESVVKILE